MANFEKRGNKWRYRISYRDENGNYKRKSKGGFRTKAEAKAEATRVENEINLGVNVNQGDRDLAKYYEEWIETYKIGQYSEGTDNHYYNALKLIEEYFPKYKLKEVTRADYQKFLNDYGKGRSFETVRKTHAKISACFKDAFHSGHITANPCYRPKLTGGKPRKRKEYLEKDEVERLIQALLDGIELMYNTRYMIILQLATGMRIGEVMALQFKDIDFLHNTVNITKSWDYSYTEDFKSTKTGESRKITIDEETANLLRPFYDYQLNSPVKDHLERLFAKKGDVPSVNAVNKALSRACKRAGIKTITSHALRHTHASILLMDGVNIAYISKRLGHKDISVTTDTYSHILAETEIIEQEKTTEIIEHMYGAN